MQYTQLGPSDLRVSEGHRLILRKDCPEGYVE